ncbi:MAG: hypothetical protein AB3N23_14215 [Paracoccaceae bacterium]
MKIEKLGMWVGIVGGGLGVLSAVGGGMIAGVQYFATQDQLRRVDCYYFYKAKQSEASLVQTVYNSLYIENQAAAVSAEIIYRQDETNENKLLAYRQAVEKQDRTLDIIQEAGVQAETAKEEIGKCGYQEKFPL